MSRSETQTSARSRGLCDLDIRRALRRELDIEHGDDEDTLIINELGLCQGSVRVDMAVVNGSITGFEIKSERDTLDRLPEQARLYSRTLDSVVIVAGGNHTDRVATLVPDWWGIWRAESDGDRVCFQVIRPPGRNHSVDPLAVVQLLWRDEVLEALRELGADKGMLSKPRRALWEKLASSVTTDQLKDLVRRRLKAREDWRSA